MLQNSLVRYARIPRLKSGDLERGSSSRRDNGMRQSAYENYCEWCRRLGIEPASFTGWATGAGSHPSSANRRDLRGASDSLGASSTPTQSRSPAPRKRSYIGLFALAAIIVIAIIVLAMRSQTAICADGSRSYSGNEQGTCSWHGGVKSWGR